MNQRLVDISLRRGRLLERISVQRAQLAREIQPVRQALYTVDRAAAVVRSASDYLKRHPGQVAAVVGLLAIMKPRRLWRWARRGFLAWRTWRSVNAQMINFGLRSRG
jgi:hypothetical protein